jgi:uncharacterized protein YbcI
MAIRSGPLRVGDSVSSDLGTVADGREDGTNRAQSLLQEICNEMVRLFKEQFGRGPTSGRASWAGADVVVVVLEGTLTPAARTLIKLGEHERLREMRMLLQYASVREFCDPVERLTGRRVRAFISGIDTEADGLSVQTFVLHPAGAEAPSRSERAGF